MLFPFEVPFSDLEKDLDAYADTVIASLESDFLVMPRGEGFVEFATFENAYEHLKKATRGFRDLTPETVRTAATAAPVTLIVLRSMLGFTPSEWAHITTSQTGITVSQNQARAIDRRIRKAPLTPLQEGSADSKRIAALVEAACALLCAGAPELPKDKLHRLDKTDTRAGGPWFPSLATMGVSYAMLLYERFLGRPFAGHRDSVSELIGDVLESAIEDILDKAGISKKKTKRVERIPGFDQAPDFIIPSAENPSVVIEAKITEDDGTARDKVTRIQHLAETSTQFSPPFEVVACIAGRGFKQRREDMKKLIRATKGKVFTPATLGRLVECTRLRHFVTSPP